ncbi:ATP-dependent DNA helicase pif1-like [Helianthus annuus]|uniref:ATP-dependent DNA helicase pif1-like n=1 Tax=Helianthus annuus TaxID=4232 RepID=UPI001653393E|nr:ATP-dependent DNA helicase pif1-like [Helianthus annuus]
MPYPDTSSLDNFRCRLINEELSYDRTELENVYQGQVNLLTDEQRAVYEEIMNAVDGDNGGVFFVYGYGGTGKTFLWKTLSAAIRSKGEIVLNVASSGIASLLLEGGRTAHSRFHIPLNLNEDSQTKLIIWDEAPMVHKHAFEALDRTMHDIFNISNSSRSDVVFGGKVVVFGGDFRQILPVVPNGGRHEIVNASLCSSYLWSKCKLLTLTRNMRLTVGRPSSEVEEISNFAKWLLDVGEGNVGGSNDGEAIIEIPPELLIDSISDPISSLIDFVYPSILENYNDRNYFSTRAILAPKNEVVHEVNDRLLAVFPGEEKEYLSSDSLCPTEDGNADQQKIYSPDVLNGLKVSGLPNHRLVLKVGVPVMLLRNIDQRNGLCNGTRLKVTKLYSRVIEAEIISGGNIAARTFIPRMNLVPSDKKIPFAFQRRQFPITVCFAMTINKSQGQSLSKVGLYLRQPVFTHGQLYVALSRVTRRDGIKLLILDNEGRPTNKTMNVVYKDIQCIVRMERLEFEMFANEILSRLPTKCVARLRCVSKQWRYELSSHLFAIIHYRRTAKYEIKDAVGIYIDSSNDVKILLLQRRKDDVVPRMYSRNTCEWKTLTFLKGPDYGSSLYWLSSGTLCNNVLYFPSPHYWTPAKRYTIAFDVDSETFSKVSIPQCTDVIGRQSSFFKIRNTLHMFIFGNTPEKKCEAI